MNTFNAISHLSTLLNSPSLSNYAKILDASFSRNRIIILDRLLHYLIFRNHNVISQDIVSFFGDIYDFCIPTRQAMIKRISILNFDIWKHILKMFREEIYPFLPLYKLRDYIIIAVDGSFLDLPPHAAVNHYFGGHMTQKMGIEDIKKPQAKVSMIYDVLNRVILDFSIAHYRTSEIPMLFDHLKTIYPDIKNKKIIILTDRYYGSSELFKYCEMNGWKYIVRAKKNFFKHYIENHSDENDFYIDVHFDRAWIKRIKSDEIRQYINDDPHMQIRVVKGQYEYMEKNAKKEKKCVIEGQYFTNLEADEFNASEIIELYHCERWNIETAYDVLKNDMDIEQFNTHNPIGIINKIMGKVIFYNIERLIYMESSKRIIQKEDNQYKYIPNNKYIIYLLHNIQFIKEFVHTVNEETVDKIMNASSKEKIPVRKGRHYKRWKKFLKSIPTTRHRIDGRRNPPVSITKAGILTSNH